MNKLLDIVITHWTEPFEVGYPAIQMLALQRRINWDLVNVTIIHDGSEKFSEKHFRNLPFKVHQVCLPKSGVSAARNYAIDHSEAEWIKFCDFDDMFAGVYSLSRITDAISETNNFNTIWFPFIIDIYRGDLLLIHECSQVFIHDKIFRTSFLREKNIRFNESLSFSEDFAFISLLELEIDPKTFGKIDSNFPIYIYIQRIDSLGNLPNRQYKNRCGLFDAHCYVEEEMRKHNEIYHADLMVVRTLTENYCTILTADKSADTSELFQRTAAFYKAKKQRLDCVSGEDLDHVIEDTNNQNHIEISKAGFFQWLRQFEG